MYRLIRILLATLTGLGLMFGIAAIGAPAAVAATTKYVTPAEYRKIGPGMTMQQIHRIFGTEGKQTSYVTRYEFPFQSRVYRAKAPEGSWSRVYVSYEKINGTWKLHLFPVADWDNWWVTKAEYNALRKGMSMTQVHRIFDTTGKQWDRGWYKGYRYQIRSYVYSAPGRANQVNVMYLKVNGTWVTGAWLLSKK